jgi:hypothetical protein
VGVARLQQWMLRLGVLLSAVLLIRFAIDFSAGMKWWLAAPFCVLVVLALGVAIANVFHAGSADEASGGWSRRDPKQALFLAMIPVGFFASSLDCMGLSLQGCSPFCTFVKLVWIPLIAGVCLVYFFTGTQVLLTAIAAFLFVPVVPHCVCYNVGNAWWIDHFGVSPLCYGWGLVVGVIAVSVLRGTGMRLWWSFITCGVVIGGAVGFFVSHHYFNFPW